MTVKELMENLACYDEDSEIEISINDDIECESWTEDKWGNKSVSVNENLNIDFIGDISGNCYIEMVVQE